VIPFARSGTGSFPRKRESPFLPHMGNRLNRDSRVRGNDPGMATSCTRRTAR